MTIPKYDRSKHFRIMDRAQSNYANQLKRLSRNAKRSNFILIYYSLALIICALSIKFYPALFNETWISYSNIILSIIVLIYSIINSKADYTNRISKIQVALNEVKRLKRELGALEENANDKFDKLKNEYDSIVSSTEVRDDLDFFHTVRQLCKLYGINHITGKLRKGYEENDDNKDVIREIRGYISEINPILQWGNLICLFSFHIIIYLVPLTILGVGILTKN